MWQRFMARLLKDTKIKERFTEHDLRAKCASDAETLGRAQQLLGHADSKIRACIPTQARERTAAPLNGLSDFSDEFLDRFH
jgi:integrase